LVSISVNNVVHASAKDVIREVLVPGLAAFITAFIAFREVHGGFFTDNEFTWYRRLRLWGIVDAGVAQPVEVADLCS